jgi:hypothetical protein
MKKYLFRFLTLALIVPALASCAGQLEDNLPLAKKHTVYFSTVVGGQATRTGLTIDGNNVVPDWRFTDPEDVHVFEMDGTANAHLGTASSIDPYDNYIGANFKADIEDEITIIVTPPSTPDPDGDGAKVLRQGSNTYGAVVAKSKEVEGKPVFYIPAVQTPDAETLKDPGAEFLVGYSRDGYDAITLDEEGTIVDLYFDRVAALSRIGFTNFSGEDEKVISVKINSQSSMTGSVKASDISFGNSNSVITWTPDTGEGAGVLTLSYGEGADIPTDKPFYAYFVSMPGRFNITSIEVLTDQYHYTKTVGKEVVFDLTSLKDLNADLSKNTTAEEIASNVWYKASMLEAGYDYIIVSAGQALKNNDGTADAVAVSPDNGVITFESVVDPTIVWRANAHTEMTGENGVIAGHFTLTNNGYYVLRTSGSAVGLGTAIPSDKPKYAVWDYDGSYLKHMSDESRIFYWFYSSNKWTTGYTEGSAAPGSDIGTVDIYTNRAPQEPGFDPTGPFTFDIDQFDVNPDADFNEPELIDYYGDVTYSSSDESIATVDASGDVTILKAGTVEITATAAGDAKHQAATASYIINITTSKIPTWYKAEEIENNKDYLIVSNGYALRNNNNSIAALQDSDVQFSGDSFQYDAADDLLWHATESGTSFKFTNNNRYIRYSSSLSLSTTDNNNTCTYDGTYLKVGNRYLFTNNGSWTTSSSSGNTKTASLYSQTPPLQPRNLHFSSDGVTIDYATSTDVNEPTLEGIKDGDVTYTSSNTAVATVDPNSGVVSLTGTRGSVRIIATAPKTDSYKDESVSYSLIVKNSNVTTSTKTYYKIGSVANLEPGAQYLLVFEGLAGDTDGDGNPKVFKPILATDGTTFTKSTANALDVEITNGMISSNAFVDSHLTLETGYFFKANNANKYLYPKTPSSGGGIISAENSASTQLNITFSEGIAHIIAKNDTYYLVWSTSSHYFSSNTDVEGQYSTGICLYVLDDSGVISEKQERNLAFSATSVTCTYGETPTWPTLSGVTTGVQYTSSNTDVATIDVSGAVTIKAAGTTTIKAEAAEDDNYLAGSAQYTLTVNPAAQSSTYVLIPSSMGVVSGKNYLIVSADASNYNGADHKKAFAGDEAGTAGDVSASNGAITGAYSDYEFTITKSGSNYTLLGPNGYVTGNQNKTRYIEVSSSEVTMSLATASELSTASSGDGMVADAFYFYYTKSSSKEVLYYNSDKAFKMGGTGRKYGVYLYMKYNGEQLAQNLSFSKDAASYNMASSASFTAPTLSGAMTTVTYSSSKPGVATVDASTGAVSFVGVGETTITATAVADTYNGINYGTASASYTLTVTNEEITAHYEKITSTDGLAVGEKYLIVYESTDGNKLFKPLLNDSKNRWQTATGNAINVEIADNVIASNETTDACAILLDNQKTGEFTYDLIVPKADGATDYYLVVYNNSNTFVATTSTGYRPTISFSDGIASIKRSNYFIRYSASNSYFQVTSSNSANICLYKYVE